MKTWSIKKLGEICKIKNGFAFKSSNFVNEGIPLIRISNIKFSGEIDLSKSAKLPDNYKKEYSSFLVKKGDILIAMSGATTGKTGLYNLSNQALLNQRVGKFEPDLDLIDSCYLNYLSRHISNDVLNRAKGMAQPNISSKTIESIEIPLPPLSEQKRIVEKIEKLFAKVDEAIRLRTEALSTSAAILPSAVHQVFSRAKKEGWKYKTFGEIIEIDTIRNTKNNLPFVGMEDVESHSGNFIGSRDPKEVKSTTFHFDTRHVLYGKLRPYLNKVLLSNFEGHCSTEFLPLLPDNKFLVREWLTVWLRYEKTVDNIMGTNSGSRMPRANMDKVKEFKIPLPPISEQRKIVDYLDSLSKKTQELIFYQKFQLKDLEELKQSILHKAFNEGL